MIFHLSLRTSGIKASVWLVGHDPQWAVESKDYYTLRKITIQSTINPMGYGTRSFNTVLPRVPQ